MIDPFDLVCVGKCKEGNLQSGGAHVGDAPHDGLLLLLPCVADVGDGPDDPEQPQTQHDGPHDL